MAVAKKHLLSEVGRLDLESSSKSEVIKNQPQLQGRDLQKSRELGKQTDRPVKVDFDGEGEAKFS